MSGQTVLLVDDETEVGDLVLAGLDGEVNFIQALTVQIAREILAIDSEDIIAVLLDGNVPGPGGTTTELARELRKDGYFSWIIGISNDPDKQKELMEAGCTQMTSKESAGLQVLKLLGLRAR